MAIKSTEDNARQSRRRLKQIDDAHRLTLAGLRADFNQTYDALLAKHNLTIGTLADHHSFPIAFHEDLAEAKRAYMAGHDLAQQARASSVASLAPTGQRLVVQRHVRFA